MAHAARQLEAEPEIIGRFFDPAQHRLPGRRRIKRRVALDGGQAFGILAQIVGLLRPFREEVTYPALMRPDRRTEKERHG